MNSVRSARRYPNSSAFGSLTLTTMSCAHASAAVGDDVGAGGDVVGVADRRALAGTGLDEHVDAVAFELAHAVGGHRDAVLGGLDLAGDPDGTDDGRGAAHGVILPPLALRLFSKARIGGPRRRYGLLPSMTNREAPRVALGPDRIARMARGGDPRRRRRGGRARRMRGDRVGGRPRSRRARRGDGRGTEPAVGPAAVRRDRELHRASRRRLHLDVRQGRLRRTCRRDGADPRPRRPAQRRCVRQGHVVVGARRAATCSAGGSRSSAAAGSPSRSCGSSQPWDCHITVVRNHAQHMDGVDDVLESDRFADALPGADLVVLALVAHPGDRRPVRPRRVRVDGRPRLDRERGAGPSHHHRPPRRGTAEQARSAAPGSMSPIPNRCPTATRCGRCRTASSPPTSGTRRRWPSRCWPRG